MSRTNRRPPFLICCLVLAVSLSGCQAEQRPGTVERIGSPQTSSVSGVTGSVSGVSRPTGSPLPAAAAGVTRGDGVYTPVGDVDQYTFVALDVADIVELTNAVNDGRPLPTETILDIYQNGKNSRSATGLRTLRAFARNDNRGRDFPVAAQFYGSPTFLDDQMMDAINGSGSASTFTPAQRRQAIQKSLQRILAYFMLQELGAAEPRLRDRNLDPATGAPHNVDEAWALYMGAPRGNTFPNALSATAVSREANYRREGTIDRPLREALQRAQSAAVAGNLDAFQTAKRDVESRLNALFYLSGARYLHEALRTAQSGNIAGAGASQIEGWYYYMTIQPEVARADAAADRLMTAYYRDEPGALTLARRDEALAALNRTADALGLRSADLLRPADYQ